MADQPQPPTDPHLDRNQQHLLLAALDSQASKPTLSFSDTSLAHSSTMTTTGDNLFISPRSAELDSFADFTPELDYLDGDNSFDFDTADLGGDMIGALPGSDSHHEKRKSPDENGDAENGDAKRQETQEGERTGKKPGRKPLTSEPTTKRKAQNRAAQRAFRERKEKHLKDLETQVTDLTKSAEADRHENGLLRAQVDRLQTELREYRKRLSLNGVSGQANRSPTLTGVSQRSNSGSAYGANQFAFDFPKFGALPGNLMIGDQSQTSPGSAVQRDSVTPPVSAPSRHSSQGRGLTPQELSDLSNSTSPQSMNNITPSVGYSTINNMHGFANTLPQMNETSPFGDLFSPSVLKGTGLNGANFFDTSANSAQTGAAISTEGGESTAGFNRAFQFNSGSSISDSASPSGSSTSQWQGNGTTSSCGTSPEPSHDSPGTKDVAVEKGSQLRNGTTADEAALQNVDFSQTDFAVPSSTTFDPTLFGDYRDTAADNLFGTTDLNGSFFDDAFGSGPFDMGSPSNLFGILQSPGAKNSSLPANAATPDLKKPCEKLMADMERARAGGDDDYGLPSSQKVHPAQEAQPKLISCNNIWNQLQSNPAFQEGQFDLDGLCSELRTKAKCSESGVMVNSAHVDAALRKLGQKDHVPSKTLMFDQSSWDKVIHKMNGQN